MGVEQESRLSGEDTTNDYIVSLAVNRAVSPQAMSKLEDFYVSGMGTKKTHDSTDGRADSETSTSFKVGDFEDMLNAVHKTIIDGHSWCPMDRWFDNHYAIDSHSIDNTKILNYINSKKPFHTCGSNPMRGTGLSAVFDPTGLGIQMDTGTGLPNDCSSSDDLPGFLQAEGHSNP